MNDLSPEELAAAKASLEDKSSTGVEALLSDVTDLPCRAALSELVDALIREHAQVLRERSKVATLVEQLGDAERRASTAKRRVEELERQLQALAERCGPSCAREMLELRTERDVLTANVATLVEQLGEAERRCKVLAHHADAHRAGQHAAEQERDALRGAAQVLIDELDCDVSGNCARCRELLASMLAAPSTAGAAQPVVEPKPKGVWVGTWLLDILRCIEEGNPTSQEMARGALAALGEYAAGYAPHPSGTEGPTAVDVAVMQERRNFARALRIEAGQHQGTASEKLLWSIARGIDNATFAAYDKPAASPPDGTAPERRRDLPPGWRYAGGDKQDPGACERTADGKQAVDEQAAWDVERGTAPERALAQRADDEDLFVSRHRFRALKEGDKPWQVLGDNGDGSGDSLVEAFADYDDRLVRSDATRPPDGMPGEPREPVVLGPPTSLDRNRLRGEINRVQAYTHAEKWRALVGALRDHGAELTVESSHVDVLMLIEDEISEASAPPTVPGEPPRCICTHRFIGPRKRISNCPVHGDAAPPTPPLTPERAPLDEVAVRADERRRTEMDIFAHIRETLNIKCVDIIDSRYPRRREGGSDAEP